MLQRGEVCRQLGWLFGGLLRRDRAEILSAAGMDFVEKRAKGLGHIGKVLRLEVHPLRLRRMNNNLFHREIL